MRNPGGKNEYFSIDKMLEENLILRVGAGSTTEYKLK